MYCLFGQNKLLEYSALHGVSCLQHFPFHGSTRLSDLFVIQSSLVNGATETSLLPHIHRISFHSSNHLKTKEANGELKCPSFHKHVDKEDLRMATLEVKKQKQSTKRVCSRSIKGSSENSPFDSLLR